MSPEPQIFFGAGVSSCCAPRPRPSAIGQRGMLSDVAGRSMSACYSVPATAIPPGRGRSPWLGADVMQRTLYRVAMQSMVPWPTCLRTERALAFDVGRWAPSRSCPYMALVSFPSSSRVGVATISHRRASSSSSSLAWLVSSSSSTLSARTLFAAWMIGFGRVALLRLIYRAIASSRRGSERCWAPSTS